MIPDSILNLLQTGVSVMVGTRDASLMPECTRAWGIHVGADRGTVIVLLSEAFAGQTLDNLRENGRIAVTCTRPTDHITCQLKGRVRSMKPVTSANRETSRQWHREFIAELRAIGVPSALGEAWIVEPTVAVEMAVTDVFDQTPGPGAGKKISR
ncbi:MAG TPA: pyridoxamine 5'-phosphate oxidase family protein [Nitrospira sp.]|nr:pyridoxamine 5'-phosphate oxidase family protein [Nitrospira sp.]